MTSTVTSNDLRRQLDSCPPGETGRLAIMCCSKKPTATAYRRRNTIYSEEKKLILFVTTADLIEMLDIKDRGEHPSDFIIDSVEDFYLQHD